MDERELFTESFDASEEATWQALKRALQTMDLSEVDESARRARFSTGVSLTSWGEHMIAQVTGDERRSTITVHGRPKGSLLTTEWGEDLHAKGVQKDIRRAVENVLA